MTFLSFPTLSSLKKDNGSDKREEHLVEVSGNGGMHYRWSHRAVWGGSITKWPGERCVQCLRRQSEQEERCRGGGQGRNYKSLRLLILSKWVYILRIMRAKFLTTWGGIYKCAKGKRVKFELIWTHSREYMYTHIHWYNNKCMHRHTRSCLLARKCALSGSRSNDIPRAVNTPRTQILISKAILR